jgi:chromate reductase, NAD(P)H dehydrogenase (quinone)
VRSQKLAQQRLLQLGCLVVPQQAILPRADQAFDASGALIDARSQKSIHTLAAALVDTTGKLNPPNA